jgi:predicted  nucleic acid-binding Zn-ribbon protein
MKEEVIMVNEKDLYKRKIQAQVDIWKAELKKFQAQLAGNSADMQMKIKQEIKDLEGKIEEGEAKLKQLGETGDDAWESIKDSVKSAWESWNLPGIKG